MRWAGCCGAGWLRWGRLAAVKPATWAVTASSSTQPPGELDSMAAEGVGFWRLLLTFGGAGRDRRARD